MEQISRARIRLLRGLTHRSVRARRGRVLVEGFRAVEAALQSGREIPLLVLTSACVSHERAGALLTAAAERGIAVCEIPPSDLDGIADAVTGQGVLAVVVWGPIRGSTPEAIAARLRASSIPALLCLDGVSDPGNAGTLARTARAFGLGGLVLSRGSVEATHPKFLRAAAGALFSLDLVADGIEPAGLLKRLQMDGWTVLKADAGAGRDPRELTPSPPWVLVLGSEAHGLSEELAEIGEAIHIPLEAGADSLNVAVAGGILLHLLTTGRTRAGPRQPP